MAKATDTTRPFRQTTTVHLTLPKDAELAALLTGTGLPHEGLINGLAIAADPGSGGSNVVTLPLQPHARGRVGHADAVAADLAELLTRTPPGTPGRDALVSVAAQLGVHEDQAEPEAPPFQPELESQPEPAPEPPAADAGPEPEAEDVTAAPEASGTAAPAPPPPEPAPDTAGGASLI